MLASGLRAGPAQDWDAALGASVRVERRARHYHLQQRERVLGVGDLHEGLEKAGLKIQKMSAALLKTCLGFPTLGRRPRAMVDVDDSLPAEKRQEWEVRAQDLAREKTRVVRLPIEDEDGLVVQLQSSILDLKAKLFQATCDAQHVRCCCYSAWS
jgi:hypothetical protein